MGTIARHDDQGGGEFIRHRLDLNMVYSHARSDDLPLVVYYKIG
jgi:hypothetical protein